MTTELSADVVIVGAGPVGLTLATDLAQRGRTVIVLETRAHGEPPSVKCNHVAARSMELFRRLGVADRVRNAGLPDDYPHDIAYRTTMTGRELTRIPIPARRDRFTKTDGPDGWWPTPEPPHRINQIFLEPILFEHAWETAGVTILNRVAFLDFTQDESRVTARAQGLDDAAAYSLSAAFLIGCDGGRSSVRRGIGARLEGDAVVQRVQSSYIRAPRLLEMLTTLPAWGNISMNPRRSGTVYAIDGRETWLVHNYLRDSEPDFDSVDRDWALREILGVDDQFEYAVISREDWYGRRLVANRFRDRRAFICGDAAHLWVPYAGYGMNAGLADAANLAWLLAAYLDGWGTWEILDAHERERLPITEQVSVFAMNHAHEMAKHRRAVPTEIESNSPEGEAARARVGRESYDLNVQQYAAAGLNFGYYYDTSPIIAYDGEQPPPYSMGSYSPSSVPGCRTHHLWLNDGRSLFDVLGPNYALLRFDQLVDIQPMIDAAQERGVPLRVVDVDPSENDGVFTTSLVISRPDGHVGWRGDRAPSAPLALIDLLRGASTGA
jgi:2-polyprenyl-6-methoxyphenol hydroxylase-like FAD-dependent oxidoreductase